MKKSDKQHKSKNSDRTSKKSSVLASLHSIVICGLLLTSFCFAWFTEVVKGPSVTVKTATYGIMAEVSCNGAVVTRGDCNGSTEEGGLMVELESGKVHDILLTGLGTASKYGGYCIVSAGDDVRYTELIYPNGELKFKIWFNGDKNGRIKLIPSWGYYPESVLEKVDEGEKPMLNVKYAFQCDGEYVVSGGDIMVSGGDDGVPETVSLIK